MYRHALIALAILAPSPALAQVCKDCSLTLTGDEAPKVQLWTQPAAVSWVGSSDDKNDRLTLDLAARLQQDLAPSVPDLPIFGESVGWFVSGLAHVNDQSKKEQESYKVGIGLSFDRDFVAPDASESEYADALFLQTDFSVAWASKVTFPDLASTACVADPALATCREQTQQSVRVAADFAFYQRILSISTTRDDDRDGKFDPGYLAAAISPPLVQIFHDEVIEAVLNTAGVRETGGATGIKLVVGGAVSPSWFHNRLTLKASYQVMYAPWVSTARQESFKETTDLAKISLDFEFGARSWDKGAGWQPSVGVAYSVGEDPLDGRRDTEETTVGLRLTYKGS